MTVFKGELLIPEYLLTADDLMMGLEVLGSSFLAYPTPLDKDDTEKLGLLLVSLSQLANLSKQIHSQME